MNKKSINMIMWRIKNKKSKMIADILRYKPSLKKYKKELFKKSKIELHYLRYKCMTELRETNKNVK